MKPAHSFSISLGIVFAIGALFTNQLGAESPASKSRRERFTPKGPAPDEAPAGYFYIEGVTKPVDVKLPRREAKTGFDNLTNGFAPQGPDFDTLNEDNVVPLRSYNDDRFEFEQ